MERLPRVLIEGVGGRVEVGSRGEDGGSRGRAGRASRADWGS